MNQENKTVGPTKEQAEKIYGGAIPYTKYGFVQCPAGGKVPLSEGICKKYLEGNCPREGLCPYKA